MSVLWICFASFSCFGFYSLEILYWFVIGSLTVCTICSGPQEAAAKKCLRKTIEWRGKKEVEMRRMREREGVYWDPGLTIVTRVNWDELSQRRSAKALEHQEDYKVPIRASDQGSENQNSSVPLLVWSCHRRAIKVLQMLLLILSACVWSWWSGQVAGGLRHLP